MALGWVFDNLDSFSVDKIAVCGHRSSVLPQDCPRRERGFKGGWGHWRRCPSSVWPLQPGSPQVCPAPLHGHRCAAPRPWEYRVTWDTPICQSLILFPGNFLLGRLIPDGGFGQAVLSTAEGQGEGRAQGPGGSAHSGPTTSKTFC